MTKNPPTAYLCQRKRVNLLKQSNSGNVKKCGFKYKKDLKSSKIKKLVFRNTYESITKQYYKLLFYSITNYSWNSSIDYSRYSITKEHYKLLTTHQYELLTKDCLITTEAAGRHFKRATAILSTQWRNIQWWFVWRVDVGHLKYAKASAVFLHEHQICLYIPDKHNVIADDLLIIKRCDCSV